MVELPHVLVGAAIATKVSNPFLGITLAFASHFILDLIPHSNPHIYTELKKQGKLQGKTIRWVILDSASALIAGLAIASFSLPDLNKALVVVLASFFAVLPDLLEAPYYFLGTKHPWIVRLVEFEHSLQTNTSFIPGTLTQVAVSITALWWIFSG